MVRARAPGTGAGAVRGGYAFILTQRAHALIGGAGMQAISRHLGAAVALRLRRRDRRHRRRARSCNIGGTHSNT